MLGPEFSISKPSQPACAVEICDLTKTYKLYPSKGARIAEVFDLFRRTWHREFQALEKVSVSFPVGATVGILGVNGSGKSTLLQLVCGIIEASSGSVKVNGRIAALLELGAGFNPDLSGRENVALNALILGLSRQMIEQRMPAIEQFAEVGEFFDQPVKIYSSGMLMRVAFAVAIHVDPDILIIDEALAVGDARFQQKCFRRFNEFQQAGKTIILVTHDRFSVPRLCTHAMVLNGGKMVFWGDPKKATEIYGNILIGTDQPVSHDGGDMQIINLERPDPTFTSASNSVAPELEFEASTSTIDLAAQNPLYNPNEFRTGNGKAKIIDFLVIDGKNINPATVTSGNTINLILKVAFLDDCSQPNLGITIQSKEGVIVFAVNALWLKTPLAPRRKGDLQAYKMSIRCDLGSQDWFLSLAIADGSHDMYDQREGLIHLRCETNYTSYGFIALPTTIEQL